MFSSSNLTCPLPCQTSAHDRLLETDKSVCPKQNWSLSLEPISHSPVPMIPIKNISILQVAQVQNMNVIFLALFIVFYQVQHVHIFNIWNKVASFQCWCLPLCHNWMGRWFLLARLVQMVCLIKRWLIVFGDKFCLPMSIPLGPLSRLRCATLIGISCLLTNWCLVFSP